VRVALRQDKCSAASVLRLCYCGSVQTVPLSCNKIAGVGSSPSGCLRQASNSPLCEHLLYYKRVERWHSKSL